MSCIAPWHQVVHDFKKVLPYLLIGIEIGSFIYGFVPTEFIAKYKSGISPLAVQFGQTMSSEIIRTQTILAVAAMVGISNWIPFASI